MPTGIELITAERQRQIEQEGWTAQHDDQHTDESLAACAGMLALAFDGTRHVRKYDLWVCHEYGDIGSDDWASKALEKFYNDDRLRQLVIAGALIAAEIDRLQRAKGENDGN